MPDTPEYKVGDVVNGYRLGTDGQWYPAKPWTPPDDMMQFETEKDARLPGAPPQKNGSVVVKVVAIIAALVGLMVIVGAILVATGNGPAEEVPVSRATPTVVPSLPSPSEVVPTVPPPHREWAWYKVHNVTTWIAGEAAWRNLGPKERRNVCFTYDGFGDYDSFLNEYVITLNTGNVSKRSFAALMENKCGS